MEHVVATIAAWCLVISVACGARGHADEAMPACRLPSVDTAVVLQATDNFQCAEGQASRPLDSLGKKPHARACSCYPGSSSSQTRPWVRASPLQRGVETPIVCCGVQPPWCTTRAGKQNSECDAVTSACMAALVLLAPTCAPGCIVSTYRMHHQKGGDRAV